MALQCDVCKGELPGGTRFCPRCGLEIVPERERAARPPALDKESFDWDDDPAKPKLYTVSKQQQPVLVRDKLAEMLEQAKTRLADGYVVETAAVLKQIRAQVARHVALRPAYEELDKAIQTRRQAIRDRCQKLADAGESNSVLALLAGPAINEMEQEEICVLALEAARTFYAAQYAEEAADLLRIAPFRALRDEGLVAEHRELEAIVHRRRYWQHWRQSVTILGGMSVACGIGLAVWAWFLWESGLAGARWFGVPGLLVAIAFLLSLPQLRPHLEKWFRQFFDDEGPGGKLKARWKNRRRKRK